MKDDGVIFAHLQSVLGRRIKGIVDVRIPNCNEESRKDFMGSNDTSIGSDYQFFSPIPIRSF